LYEDGSAEPVDISISTIHKSAIQKNGTGPGIAFEDLPDSWACFECGAGKDMFERREKLESGKIRI
jgi:rubredoxin